MRNITRSVDDLNALVERCAQADQIEQGGAPVRKAAFSANELVRDLVEAMGSERIVIVANREFRVCSDHQYLRLILQNLLSNALKYSEANSMVTLGLHTASGNGVDGVMFHVSNTVGLTGRPIRTAYLPAITGPRAPAPRCARAWASGWRRKLRGSSIPKSVSTWSVSRLCSVSDWRSRDGRFHGDPVCHRGRGQ